MQGNVRVGQPAPEFAATCVVGGSYRETSLSDYSRTNRWLVLAFFPKAWSFLGPREICDFSDRLEEFVYSHQCHVVFASTDSPECLHSWTRIAEKEGGLGNVHLPLLSDCTHSIARDYGVLIEEEGVAQRALFIIDPKGIVRAININDVDSGRSVDETLRLLEALAMKDRFGDEHPGSWRKKSQSQSTNATPNSALHSHTPIFRKSWSGWNHPKLQRTWSGSPANSSESSESTICATTPHISPMTTVPLSQQVQPPHVIRGGEAPAHRRALESASHNALQKALDDAHNTVDQYKLKHTDPIRPRGLSEHDQAIARIRTSRERTRSEHIDWMQSKGLIELDGRVVRSQEAFDDYLGFLDSSGLHCLAASASRERVSSPRSASTFSPKGGLVTSVKNDSDNGLVIDTNKKSASKGAVVCPKSGSATAPKRVSFISPKRRPVASSKNDSPHIETKQELRAEREATTAALADFMERKGMTVETFPKARPLAGNSPVAPVYHERKSAARGDYDPPSASLQDPFRRQSAWSQDDLPPVSPTCPALTEVEKAEGRALMNEFMAKSRPLDAYVARTPATPKSALRDDEECRGKSVKVVLGLLKSKLNSALAWTKSLELMKAVATEDERAEIDFDFQIFVQDDKVEFMLSEISSFEKQLDAEVEAASKEEKSLYSSKK